jgi:hypothetical protein
MAQTVKILTWNIQNFGETKASFDDIVNAVARVVVKVEADIFVLLEVNTTANTTADYLMSTMVKALYKESGRAHYKVCVRSPNTGLEFYGFFVRDDDRTQPLIAVRTSTGGPAMRIGNGALAFKEVEFRRYQPVRPPSVANGIFPLLLPDLLKENLVGFNKIPEWPGKRLPVVGMFWCPDASGLNRLLPIVAHHFNPNPDIAAEELSTLRYLSLLQGVGPAHPSGRVNTDPVTVRLELGSSTRPKTMVPGYVLTGDFNINYLTEKQLYTPVSGSKWPQLGANPLISRGTHLMTYRQFEGRPREIRLTEQLAINGYDNILLRNSPRALQQTTARAPTVQNIPEEIRTRKLKLIESVKHYGDLDKKGFQGGRYAEVARNFADQLGKGGQFVKTPINIQGSLVGARLISDHLPVYAELRLP